HFGRDPKGIWLPECAYRPGYHWIPPTEPDSEGIDRLGVEKYLQKYGIRYFIVDSHLIKGGEALGVYLERFEGLKQLWEQSSPGEKSHSVELDELKNPHQLHWLAETLEGGDPVGILSRDEKTSLQVWSGKHGYPGDGQYLDFHKMRFPGGHRYWRVTHSEADLGDKEIYELDKIESRLEENANHFVSVVYDVLNDEKELTSENKIVVAPFDTELFGHWWYEGPRWLEKVLEKLAGNENIQTVTGNEIIESTKNTPVVELPEGSWGEGGFHYIWYNEETKWTWQPIYDAERKMTELARNYSDTTGEILDVLKQLARELLLLESSDWQFLISTKAARDYAELRFKGHVDDFNFLVGYLEEIANNRTIKKEDRNQYQEICSRDPLFREINPYYWA
ncbi:DUF1957 domain-containing protein, partial [bacterium]|nr:DUF1957 domain-containing protein [bacterium]